VPLHLRPATPYAPDVLLPGDPARALALAQQLLTEPKMSNHARGLWGYTGETEAGKPLSIQSTGIGGPSAAVVIHELAELGMRRGIRVGTCGAHAEDLGLGDLVVLGEARASDGTSRVIADAEETQPDRTLTESLAEAAGTEPRTGASSDFFYEDDAAGRAESARWGADIVEMEAATLFALAARLGFAAACIVIVSDKFEGGSRSRIGDEALQQAVQRMGAVAAAALT
jgi:uridine phosphorylase